MHIYLKDGHACLHGRPLLTHKDNYMEESMYEEGYDMGQLIN